MIVLMKFLILISMILMVVLLIGFLSTLPVEKTQMQEANYQLIKHSEDLLYSVKTESPTDFHEQALARFLVKDLINGLPNDAARKTFWINIYNAYYQTLAAQNLKPSKIFSKKAIRFADATFSLDDVEHGILRKYRWKYSLGYLPQWFPGNIIKQLAVEKIDYRIHFALNCGAKSCPPIAFYTYEKIDAQLDMATRSFLETETEFDDINKVVYATKIMQWFKADFGGNAGIRNLLNQIFGRSFQEYKISYHDYNWQPSLKNFR